MKKLKNTLLQLLIHLKKSGEEKFITFVRHNLGLMYAGQNLSELAIRYLSEVIQELPKDYKAIFY